METVLITGASSGIGYELAKVFAKNGHNLVLTARNENALNQLADEVKKEYHVSAKVIAEDLSKPTAPEKILEQIEQDHAEIDILVNNAGFGSYGLFHETSLTTSTDILQVNVVALTRLTKLILQEMIKKKSGKVLNVASTAAFHAGPLEAVYAASKAYVLSFSEALENELREFGISVTALCPGATETGFQKRAGMENCKVWSGPTMNAKTVAEIGYQALMNKRSLTIPGLRNKVLIAGAKLVPRSWATHVTRRMLERTDPTAP